MRKVVGGKVVGGKVVGGKVVRKVSNGIMEKE